MQSRRDVLIKIATAATSAAVAPLLGDEHSHAMMEQAEAAVVPSGPVFFSQEDYATIARLSDLIIPRTDTPGAVDAGVPHWIDLQVSKNAELQQAFHQGLAELTTQARGMNASSFVALGEAQQIAMLDTLQTKADGFFKTLKDLTIDAYYSSEAGLVQELHYDGDTFRSSFPGCTHPEHWPSGVEGSR